ncbi:MAG: serine/threonine protein kinase [Nitrospinae bacterium]|nr:serine/threonine protein kinase [Nitrospinota bacterium]
MMPKTLGRFDVVGELGRGAMGVVYKGMDPKLQRPVALKVIQFGMSKDDADQLQIKERFLVEARATGSLQHSNILTIYDAGDEGDLTYIAMEFLEGGNLEDKIKGSKFQDYDEIIDIARQIAEGLDHAHSKGIVHRDIKPANIMMANGTVPKIADFGLARLSNSTLTTTGTVLGTPSYMAPEQIRGRKVDGRADLFALGVIFYEMLTGEKPYGGDSITSVIYRVVNEEPIPVRKLNMDLPEHIDAFMQKALAKEPGQRFQTGREFADALKALQKGTFTANWGNAGATQKIPAYEETKKIDPQQPAQKGKGLIIGGAIAAVAVIAIAAVFLMGGKKEQASAPQEQAAVAPAAPQETKKGPEKPVKEPVKPAPQAAAPAKKEPAKAAAPAKQPKADEKTALLSISSNPTGARVLLNGKAQGFTPLVKKKFKQDKYELKLEKKGYATYAEKFTLKDNMEISATLKAGAKGKGEEEPKKEGGFMGLMSSGNGTLIVNVKPGDSVTVDGIAYTTSPVEIKGIVAGSHNVFVIRKGKKPFLKSVNVKPGETVRVTPEFK